MQSTISRAMLMTLIALFHLVSVFPQAGTLTLVPANQSPDATSLGKFVEMPIGLHTGTPNIGVPLYNFPVHNLNIPVSLNYNASGIKVKDIPGQVGTGFSLNAGGVITRIVRGYPDHYNLFETDPNSYFDTVTSQKILSAYNNGNMEAGFDPSEYHHVLLSVPGVRAESLTGSPFYYWSRPLDTEMDLFYFNFLGYSGSFTFSNKGEAIIISGPKDLKITYTQGKYSITSAEGVEFHFNDREYAFMNYQQNVESKYTTSWFLSNIYIPRHKATVNFQYRQYENHQLYNQALMQDYASAFFNTTNRFNHFDGTVKNPGAIDGAGCPPYDAQSTLNYPYQFSSSLFISEISWNDNKILFYGDTTRTDVFKYKLDSIKVKAGNDSITTINLDYSYFNISSSDIAKRRLKLQNVFINDAHYHFNYIDSLYGRGTPAIYSKGQDIWGFYNGEDDEDVMPYYKLFNSNLFISVGNIINRANSTPKNSDYKWAQLGTLKSITYPTGGQTLFTYEGNDYSKAGFLHGSSTDVESDAYTQILLDSIGHKSVAATSNPTRTPYSVSNQREFVVHTDQVSDISINMGMTWGDVSYAAYIDTVYGWWSFATATVSKYNDITKSFSPVWTYTITPKDSIGYPANAAAYNSIRSKARTNSIHNIALAEGRYRIDINLTGWYFDAAIDINVKFPYKQTPGIYYAAGLRIKKIQFVSNTDKDTSYVKSYTYTIDSISSGVLESPFGNISKSFFLGAYRTVRPGLSYQNSCGSIDFSVDPLIPLGNAQGGIIGYSKVTELREDQSKVVHHFTTGALGYYYGDVYFQTFINAPLRSRVQYDNSWKRGLPIQVDYYNSAGSVVKQDFTEYYFQDTENYRKSVSMFLEDVILYPTMTTSLGGYAKTENYYVRSTGHILRSKDSSVLYTTSGAINEVTNYEYLNTLLPHAMPVKISKRDSKGEYIITRLKYPQDYTLTGANPTNPVAKSIKNLIGRNIISPAIEQYHQKSDAAGNNLRTISGQYIKYDQAGLLVDSVFSLEILSPVTGYNEIVIDSVKTVKDSRYKAKIIFSKYDSFGNISEQSKSNDVKEVLLWGYKNQYPVARVSGSDYNTVAALVDLSILNNPTSELQLLTELNKIRTHFINTPVQVLTYAYSPLKGVTAEVDARGQKKTFIYDTQGRLIQINDHDGNILKIIKYKFQLP